MFKTLEELTPKTPQQERLVTMAKQLFAFSADCIAKDPDTLMETMLVEKDDSGDMTFAVVSHLFGLSPELRARALRIALRDLGAVRYVLACEAWTARMSKDDDIESDDFVRPADRPDRVSTLMLTGEGGKDRLMGGFEIDETASPRRLLTGDHTYVDLWNLDDDDGKGLRSKGRMVDLLVD
jgi:hypothetical protein